MTQDKIHLVSIPLGGAEIEELSLKCSNPKMIINFKLKPKLMNKKQKPYESNKSSLLSDEK